MCNSNWKWKMDPRHLLFSEQLLFPVIVQKYFLKSYKNKQNCRNYFKKNTSWPFWDFGDKTFECTFYLKCQNPTVINEMEITRVYNKDQMSWFGMNFGTLAIKNLIKTILKFYCASCPCTFTQILSQYQVIFSKIILG